MKSRKSNHNIFRDNFSEMYAEEDSYEKRDPRNYELTEEEKAKCMRVFDKIFGQNFRGYKEKIMKIHLLSEYKQQTFLEVEEEI